MKVNLQFVARDAAIVAGSTFSVLAVVVFLLHLGESSAQVIELLTIMGSSAAIGWLYRKRGLDTSFAHMALYSLVVGVAVACIAGLVNGYFNPALLGEIYNGLTFKLTIMLLPLALTTYFCKVFVGMRIGQWLYGRVHPAGL